MLQVFIQIPQHHQHQLSGIKKNNKGNVKALIVNSGNANAHTGTNGLKIIDKYTTYLAKNLKCKKSQILVSSTGVIGEIFESNSPSFTLYVKLSNPL